MEKQSEKVSKTNQMSADFGLFLDTCFQKAEILILRRELELKIFEKENPTEKKVLFKGLAKKHSNLARATGNLNQKSVMVTISNFIRDNTVKNYNISHSKLKDYSHLFGYEQKRNSFVLFFDNEDNPENQWGNLTPEGKEAIILSVMPSFLRNMSLGWRKMLQKKKFNQAYDVDWAVSRMFDPIITELTSRLSK